VQLTDTPRAVLWDLDGTLIDSENYHWQSWQMAMQAENLPLTHAQFLATFGLKNDRILAAWLAPEATPERIARVAEYKESTYRRLMRAGGLSWLPKVPEWTARLAADGWKQAIASSAPRANVEAVLEVLGADALFDAIVCAEDVREGKPAPDVFLTAARRLGVSPDRCVVVEDAAAGIEAAKRAGMRSIGIRAASKAAPDLAASEIADLPVDAFDALLLSNASLG
jgi:beta-phosphoglucomutase